MKSSECKVRHERQRSGSTSTCQELGEGSDMFSLLLHLLSFFIHGRTCARLGTTSSVPVLPATSRGLTQTGANVFVLIRIPHQFQENLLHNWSIHTGSSVTRSSSSRIELEHLRVQSRKFVQPILKCQILLGTLSEHLKERLDPEGSRCSPQVPQSHLSQAH